MEPPSTDRDIVHDGLDDTLRATIRESVVAHRPVDARERESLRAFVEHFDRLEDPCNEFADIVHVTGSAIVIGRRGVVLHLHKRLQIWLQPGGHVDAGETPWDAARREVHEETGLDVEFARSGADSWSGGESWSGGATGPVPELVHVDVHPGPRGHTHLDLRYVVVAPDVDPSPPPGESQQVRWFTWDEAAEIADAGLGGALLATRARFGHDE